MTLHFALAGRTTHSLPFIRRYATRPRAVGHGQNLSERYARLEKSLREKQALATGIRELKTRDDITEDQSTKALFSKKPMNLFRGLVVPEKPRPPESDECCMSGCAVCVYDLYEESVDAYRDKMVAFRTKLGEMGVPEDEWPRDEPEKKTNVTLSVFEQMERALKEKQASQAYIRPPESLPLKRNIQEVVEGLRWALFSNR